MASRAPGRFAAFLPFVLTCSLFFMWAIGHNLNDVLVRKFEAALALSRSEASLIQVFFYIAYLVVALPAGHVMSRIGLKRTMIVGLALFVLGALAFYPAAEIGRFEPFLAALFILASGIICLEIAASTFIVLTGEPARSASRINLAQAFNGVGAIVAPLIGGIFFLSHANGPLQTGALADAAVAAARHADLQQLETPYICVACVAALIAAMICVVRFPPEAPRRENTNAGRYAQVLSAPAFRAAALGEFFYVGAQIATWSFFIDYTHACDPRLSDRTAAFLLSGSLVLFTLGRFSGAMLMRYFAPRRLLGAYALLAGLCLLGARVLPGQPAIASLMAVSFFMSIMYPTLFDLGVAAAHRQPHVGAAIMVMTIAGGALMPPLLGLISEHIGIRNAYLMLLLNFGIIAAVARVRSVPLSTAGAGTGFVASSACPAEVVHRDSPP